MQKLEPYMPLQASDSSISSQRPPPKSWRTKTAMTAEAGWTRRRTPLTPSTKSWAPPDLPPCNMVEITIQRQAEAAPILWPDGSPCRQAIAVLHSYPCKTLTDAIHSDHVIPSLMNYLYRSTIIQTTYHIHIASYPRHAYLNVALVWCATIVTSTKIHVNLYSP